MSKDYRRPNEAPLCWGLYKDTQECCLNCIVRGGCVEELVLSILEGRNKRPAAIIKIGDL